MRFADLIAKWMAAQGLEHANHAAPLLGVSVWTAYAWLDGRSLPPNPRLPHLASLLGVPLSKLRAAVAADRRARAIKAATVSATPAG